MRVGVSARAQDPSLRSRPEDMEPRVVREMPRSENPKGDEEMVIPAILTLPDFRQIRTSSIVQNWRRKGLVDGGDGDDNGCRHAAPGPEEGPGGQPREEYSTGVSQAFSRQYSQLLRVSGALAALRARLDRSGDVSPNRRTKKAGPSS